MEYRRVRLGQIGNDTTVRFAVDEIVKYLKKIDKDLFVDVLIVDEIEESFKDIIWIGIDEKLKKHLPDVEEIAEDDAIEVSVENGAGYITGTNERSVLIAAYYFLKELGCQWVRPSVEGERIPTKKLDVITANVSHAASYRHRGVCIEGAVSYDNIYDMIDFLPKIGMNEYFVQFEVPHIFFQLWYEKPANPNLPHGNISTPEIAAMVKSLEVEIKKRGLRYHKVGHGWTCVPFGIDGNGWYVTEDKDVPEDARQYLAEINGKRGFYGKLPLNTQLCYSNPVVREKMIDCVVNYCKNNTYVDLVHLWLADGSNNQCECENCQKKIPADWYVLFLNELDAKLTKENIDAKIVFLLYLDLLWEPIEQRLNNPDRFIMMFAPITRVYGENYSDHLEFNGTLPPYERNKLKLPESLAQNIEQLRRWQAQFKGDSFIFDYHMMWPYASDFGGEKCAFNLYNDMKDLDKIGLNGMVSCQVQRPFVPTALPFVMMAEALWDKNCDYEERAKAHYMATFGEDGLKAHEYLKQVSDLFLWYNAPGMGRKDITYRDFCKDYKKYAEITQAFKPVIAQNVVKDNQYTKDWKLLEFYIGFTEQMAEIFELVAKDEIDVAFDKYRKALVYLHTNEMTFQKSMDYRSVKNNWLVILEWVYLDPDHEPVDFIW